MQILDQFFLKYIQIEHHPKIQPLKRPALLGLMIQIRSILYLPRLST